MPHPVGMKARMHTNMSWTVMWGIAIKIITTDMNVMNISPLISRNTNWNSALNFRLPKDTPCKPESTVSAANRYLWASQFFKTRVNRQQVVFFTFITSKIPKMTTHDKQ